MSIPRIAVAFSWASARSFASLMPPAFPRPPIWTWALITTGYPSSSAASTASGTVLAGRPSGTGTPCFWNSCFPWYSRRSIEGRYYPAPRRAPSPAGQDPTEHPPHGSSERRQIRHVRLLRHPDRLGDRGVRRIPEGGGPGRLHDRPRRADPPVHRHPARHPARLVRAVRRGASPHGRAGGE